MDYLTCSEESAGKCNATCKDISGSGDCDNVCQELHYCGDGVQDAGEECDGSGPPCMANCKNDCRAYSNAYNIPGTVEPLCGDNISVNPGGVLGGPSADEACDGPIEQNCYREDDGIAAVNCHTCIPRYEDIECPEGYAYDTSYDSGCPEGFEQGPAAESKRIWKCDEGNGGTPSNDAAFDEDPNKPICCKNKCPDPYKNKPEDCPKEKCGHLETVTVNGKNVQCYSCVNRVEPFCLVGSAKDLEGAEECNGFTNGCGTDAYVTSVTPATCPGSDIPADPGYDATRYCCKCSDGPEDCPDKNKCLSDQCGYNNFQLIDCPDAPGPACTYQCHFVMDDECSGEEIDSNDGQPCTPEIPAG